MKLKVRIDKNRRWGFVESFKKYTWKKEGYTEALVGITFNSKELDFTIPYIYRQDEFESLDVIDKELGIEKYIKAKKPIYSLLIDGYVVNLRAWYAFEDIEGERRRVFLPEKSTFEIYSTNRIAPENGYMNMMRVYEIPKGIEKAFIVVLKKLFECNDDREVFLKTRITEDFEL